ncbi:MAG: glycosyltransferase [Firmicutes bacterium]|nr:glycosyltransferase [Alicyclobacillaceae bacterium]MCL6497573.1 glycosyltransferase [Bacillota bacterium]
MEKAARSGPGEAGPEGWINWALDHHQAVLAAEADVLILAARYGDGHLRAAKAIAMALAEIDPDHRPALLDYYRFVSPRLDSTIRWAYLSSVRFAPSLWRWFYTSTQRIDPESRTQQWLNSIGLKRFYRAIRHHPPRVIVSTYPTAAGVVSSLKKAGKLEVANYVVMTDYSVHSQWIHPAVDRYFVGSEDMRQELGERGVPAHKVVVSGIPVDQRFSLPVDEAEARARLGVGPEPVVLFMGGSYMPPGEFHGVLRAIDRVEFPHTTVVVAGRSERRRQLAEEYRRQARHPLLVLGYVDNVHEWMGVAAMLVSKAGGLTTTESLCRGLPIVIYRPIPGQEDANAAFLVRHGAGVLAHQEAEVGAIVERLLRHPWELRRMARQSRQLGHPEAARVIGEYVVQALAHAKAHAPA